jgi:hypothetical protein
MDALPSEMRETIRHGRENKDNSTLFTLVRHVHLSADSSSEDFADSLSENCADVQMEIIQTPVSPGQRDCPEEQSGRVVESGFEDSRRFRANIGSVTGTWRSSPDPSKKVYSWSGLTTIPPGCIGRGARRVRRMSDPIEFGTMKKRQFRLQLGELDRRVMAVPA